ncbi:MAG: ACP S-malonyltransferase [Holosporaceae bacterium]|jgi:[acyl-carrier-protein] S-malonyltransferase|nr:ACP S-malonyltransferase [Holosporaceae bacterium]
MRLAMFPGQGSQVLGMGLDIYNAFLSAKQVFLEVDDALSFNLSDMIFHGSADELKQTENAQPAMMAVSMAHVAALREEFGINLADHVSFFAGHSLGEYTALCASGVMSIADTAKILKIRGLAMSTSSIMSGTMAAILGLNLETVEMLINEQYSAGKKAGTAIVLQIANDNAPGQVVVSGTRNAVESFITIAKKNGAKRSVLLEVSGPFHSELMQNAAYILADCLDQINFLKPAKPIIANCTARAESDNFRELLVQQITGRVRWRESMIFAKTNGVSKCWNIGAGKVLCGLAGRTCPEFSLVNINSVKTIEEAAKMIGAQQ